MVRSPLHSTYYNPCLESTQADRQQAAHNLEAARCFIQENERIIAEGRDDYDGDDPT
jgi:hypothetical protein